MRSFGLSAVGAALVLGVAACSGDAEPHTTYFVHGSGELRVTGGRTAALPLRAATVPYGAATLTPQAPRRLAFDFGAGGGTFTFALDDFVGAGSYDVLRNVVLGLDGVAYLCHPSSSCTDCAVTISNASDAAIAGDVACASLSDCPADLAPGDPPGSACPGFTASTIRVSGTFLVDDPRNKPLDY